MGEFMNIIKCKFKHHVTNDLMLLNDWFLLVKINSFKKDRRIGNLFSKAPELSIFSLIVDEEEVIEDSADASRLLIDPQP